MLLRVIDLRGGPEEEKDADIKIVLYKDSVTMDLQEKPFTSAYYPSPLSENFRATLEWYFKDYLQETQAQGMDKEVVAKLILLGQHMGDNLLGEDHELIKVKELIEEDGFENLEVHVTSSNPDFFRELWELSVLPESKYMLSSVSKSFVRQITSPNNCLLDTEVNFDLSTDSPLKIVHLISRPVASQSLEIFDVPRSSDAFNSYVNTFGLEGAIDYEIFPVQGWAELSQRLSKDDIHILHYDGPLLFRDEKPFLLLDQGSSTVTETIPLSLLGQRLSKKSKGVLVLDVTTYLSDTGLVSADSGLAWCAKEASTCGFGNVLGLANIADPWTQSLCFNSFYSQIANGLSVGQAIVEARKFLLTQTDNAHFTGKPIPFQPWSLLQHYGGQRVTYFNTAQASQALMESTCYSEHRQQLHGFKSDYLPPQLSPGGESDLLAVLRSCRRSQAIYLSGEAGSGKTRLCHQLAIYFRGRPFERGFYFDFLVFDYSPKDILEMIAPVLLADKEGTVEEELAKDQYIFVFDNLGFHQPGSELLEFLRALTHQRHLLVVVGEEEQYPSFNQVLADLTAIEIKPLSVKEQKVLASPLLRQYEVEDKSSDADYSSLLKGLKGHPFLTTKTIPLLVNVSVELLHKKTVQLLDQQSVASIVDEFYQWQWQEMDTFWQSWLLQLIELPDVLLEMIGIACDQKKQFQPAIDLFKAFGNERDGNFSDGVRIMDQAGFLLSYSHGKVIDPRVFPFLTAKRDQDNRLIEESETAETEINIKMSQILCEGVCLLIPHLQQQANPALTHNLMMNRGLWVKHMERLWFAEEYRSFISIYSSLSQLMQQHQLSDEMAKWSMDLLSRTDQFKEMEISQREKMVVNLNVAIGALQQTELELPEFIKGAALNWQQWIEKLSSDEVKQESALFYHCIQFLELFYRQLKDIKSLRDVSKIAYGAYKAHQVWPRALPHLNTLTECSFLLKEEIQGLEYERELLQEIPYDQFPAGTQVQILAQVCASRIIRKNLDGAQLLVDQLQALDETSQLETMIDAMQADIYFHQDEREMAVQLYSRLWKLATEGHSKLNVEHLRDQLITLQGRLNGDKFNELFTEFAGAEVIQPADYQGAAGQHYPENRASLQ